MISKFKVRHGQYCTRTVCTEEGEVVCPPPANDRSTAEKTKKRQLIAR